MTELRLPPHSIDSEQCVLGAIMLDNAAYDRIADSLSESDFYRDEHRRIYRHIVQMIEAGKPVDVVTVWERLEASNEAEQTGGLAYLGDIANNVPSSANIRRWAEIVRNKRVQRDLIAAGSSVIDLAMGAGSAAENLDEAQRMLSQLAEMNVGRGEPRRASALLSEVVVDLQERFEAGGTPPGLSTSYPDIDTLLYGGLQKQDLVVLAGRPSMGKTALAINIAEAIAMRGAQVLVFSLEMTARQIMQRSLCSVGKIDQRSLRLANLSERDWNTINVAMGRLHTAPLWIDDSCPPTVEAMRARARRHMRQHGLALVVIDYLQLMVGSGPNRNEQISSISRSLKSMAREIDAPVMVLSQLSREVEKRPNKRPQMSDLRDSGAIEQDADVIGMMYREDYYAPDTPNAGVAELLIRKNRTGEVGDVRLLFNAKQSRFESFSGRMVEYRGLDDEFRG